MGLCTDPVLWAHLPVVGRLKRDTNKPGVSTSINICVQSTFKMRSSKFCVSADAVWLTVDVLQACISVDPAAGTVRLGTYRQFSYDHAFGPAVQQQDVFTTCVSGLVDAVVQGYNATVLAYGPTGSGKTHTMGMGSALHSMQEQHGIIPRVIRCVPQHYWENDGVRAGNLAGECILPAAGMQCNAMQCSVNMCHRSGPSHLQ